MFPLWLLGIGLYRIVPRLRLGFSTAVGLWFGTFALAALTQILLPDRQPLWQPFGLDGSRLLDYLYHYVIELLCAINIAAFDAFGARLQTPLARIGGAVRWLAGASFTLYLFHLPLLHMIIAWSPWPRESPISRTLLLFTVPLGCLAIAAVTERRKKLWRALFARLLDLSGVHRRA